MEVWALVISIIALIVSGFDIYYSLRMNKTNLKSEYFSKLYDEYLLKRIPEARNKIQIEAGEFTGFEELQKAVIDFLSASAFFKYADERFYNKLKEKCIALEDYLLETANKKNFKLFTPWDDIDKKIQKIYKQINKKYEKG